MTDAGMRICEKCHMCRRIGHKKCQPKPIEVEAPPPPPREQEILPPRMSSLQFKECAVHALKQVAVYAYEDGADVVLPDSQDREKLFLFWMRRVLDLGNYRPNRRYMIRMKPLYEPRDMTAKSPRSNVAPEVAAFIRACCAGKIQQAWSAISGQKFHTSFTSAIEAKIKSLYQQLPYGDDDVSENSTPDLPTHVPYADYLIGDPETPLRTPLFESPSRGVNASPIPKLGEVKRLKKDDQSAMNATLWSLICKKQRSSGAGFSGWTYPLLLRVFSECKDGNLRDRLNPLSDLVHLFLMGVFRHPAIQSFFTIQRGIAAKKPNDPDGVRPLGIMEVLTRLASSYLTCVNKMKLLEYLHDHDLGQGIPSGPETAVHAIRLFLRNVNSKTRMLIKIDTKNAFNTIPRSLLRSIIEKIDIPKWRNYFETVYADESLALYIDHVGKRVIVVNAEGVVQGDPISGWLFDLTYSVLLEPIRDSYKHRKVIILTIHDDTAIIGEGVEDVFEAYQDVIRVMSDNHLTTSAIKTKVLTLSSDENDLARIKTLAEKECISLVDQIGPAAGVEYAGAPIGTHEFMAEWIKDHKNQMFKCLEKIEEAAACLGVLTVDGEAAEKSITHFQQSATYAIRIAIPAQMLYVSRTVPPSLTLPIAKEIDERITKCIFRISTGFDIDQLPYHPSGIHENGGIASREMLIKRLLLWVPSCERNVLSQWVGVFALIGPALSKIIPLDVLLGDPIDEFTRPMEPRTPEAHQACIIPELEDALSTLKNRQAHDGLPLHPHLSLAGDDEITVSKLLRLGKKGYSSRLHAEALADDTHVLLTKIESYNDVIPELVSIAISSANDHQWFHAHPAVPGFQMDASTWRHTMCMIFGLPIWDFTQRVQKEMMEPDTTCRCCKTPMGTFAAYGFHAMNCIHLAGCKTRRHDAIRDKLLAMIETFTSEFHTRGQFTTLREPTYDHLFPGLRTRPLPLPTERTVFRYRDHHGNLREKTPGDPVRGDLALSKDMERTIYDITIPSDTRTDVHTNHITLKTRDRITKSAECGKGEKFRKAFDLVDKNQHFKGAAIGTAGAMGTGMNQLLSRIANLVTADTSEGEVGGDSARGRVITQLRQAVQITLMRGNSHCFNSWITRCCVGNYRYSRNYFVEGDDD